jgi:CspA family cold shock protein
MTTGTVKRFNIQGDLGFIQPDHGSQDIFVHISAAERAAMSARTGGRLNPAAENLRAV